jgi:hypothetical protein
MLSEQLKLFLEWKEVLMISEVRRTTGGISESCESGKFEETVQGHSLLVANCMLLQSVHSRKIYQTNTTSCDTKSNLHS